MQIVNIIIGYILIGLTALEQADLYKSTMRTFLFKYILS